MNVGLNRGFDLEQFPQAVSVGALSPLSSEFSHRCNEFFKLNHHPVKDQVEQCNIVTDFHRSGFGYVTANNFSGSLPRRGSPKAFTQAIKFNCPSNASEQNTFTTYIHPDFLISVDFAALGIPRELGGPVAGPENFIQVVLGLSDEDNDEIVLQNTLPTSLIPGINLVGMAEVVVRKQLTSNVGAMFKNVSVYHSACVRLLTHVIL